MLVDVLMSKSCTGTRRNMIGKKFGKNCVVIAFLGQNKKKRITWLAKCQCGNEFIVRTDSLKVIQQCKDCANKLRNFKDLVGVKFGEGAVVLSRNIAKEKSTQGNSIYWNCCCAKCFEIFTATTHEILSQTKRKYGYCKKCVLRHKVWKYGKDHHNYNPNLTDEDRLHGRYSLEGYADFVSKVFQRDNYTCSVCNKRGGKLSIHHLDGFHWCSSRRMDMTNGVTLCCKCHKLFHKIYGKKFNEAHEFFTFKLCYSKKVF